MEKVQYYFGFYEPKFVVLYVCLPKTDLYLLGGGGQNDAKALCSDVLLLSFHPGLDL